MDLNDLNQLLGNTDEDRSILSELLRDPDLVDAIVALGFGSLRGLPGTEGAFLDRFRFLLGLARGRYLADRDAHETFGGVGA